MPSGTHTTELDLPIEKVWDFVKDMDRWAPLVPGYIEHEIINDKQSTWTFKGDIGIMQKTVKLQIDITEWTEPSLVTFDLTGLNAREFGHYCKRGHGTNGECHFKIIRPENSTGSDEGDC